MSSYQRPLVSIGVPTRDRCNRLLRTLSSVFMQGYDNLEVIVSDNASTDGTRASCMEICAREPRLRYYRQDENIGPIPNFRFVLSKASGTYFMWIADDDWLEPNVIPLYVDFLTHHPDYSLVSGQISYWSDEGIVHVETGLSFEHDSSSKRLIDFYSRVEYGAIFYGLMRRELAVRVPLKNVMGQDWIFVGGLCRLGKVKQLDIPAYNKDKHGYSAGFENYASVMGLSRFSASFPFMSIAMTAFYDISFRCPVYSAMPLCSRLRTAALAFWGVFKRCYVRPMLKNPKSFSRRLLKSILKTLVSRSPRSQSE